MICPWLEISKNLAEIIEKMMGQPFSRMHGLEHHVMISLALLTSYKNARDIDMQ